MKLLPSSGDQINGLLRRCVSTPMHTHSSGRWYWGVLIVSVLTGCATGPRVPISGMVVDENNIPMDTVVITLKEYVSLEAESDLKPGTSGKEKAERKCDAVTDQNGKYQCNSLEGTPFRVGQSYELLIRKNAFKEGRFVIQYPPPGEYKTILYDLGSKFEPDLGTTTEKPKRSSGNGPVI